MVRRLAIPLAIAALLAAGCGGGSDDRAVESGTYVAHIPGTQAYLAAVLSPDEVAAYLCDSDGTAAWFAHHSHDGGAASLVSRSGKARLTLTPAGDGLNARVRMPDGSTHAVALERATGSAGLYRAIAKTRGGVLEGGWVVLGDGSQRGALNQFAGGGIDLRRPSETTAAPPIDAVQGTVKWALPANPSRITQPGFLGSGVDL
jgi:hypothetical protein